MIIVRNIKVPLDADFSDISALAEKALKLGFSKDVKVSLYKKGVDARRKGEVFFSCAFTLTADNEATLLNRLKKFGAEKFIEPKYIYKQCKKRALRPVVIGFGPAGMFAALCLAKAGLCPIVLERGKDADRRKMDVDAFFNGGELNEESNVQFGEGGAGTFSDGKLNTGIKDPRIREVLKVFYKHGAGENILYDSKPHIGTDVLITVVKSIRKTIESLGGEVLFQHKVTGFSTTLGSLTAVNVDTPFGQKVFKTDRAILAVGHSARDTFKMLDSLGVYMQPKAFAIGARIEHLRETIDAAQYKDFAGHKLLGAADYKLACHLPNGRGVFTFCMCPGGVVVNASSESKGVVVNGMSYSARDMVNSNSAVLVGVGVEDFYKNSALDGVCFQQQIEQRTFELTKGLPMAQTVGDFLGTGSVKEAVMPSVRPGVSFGDMGDLFPSFITDSLREGILTFDQKLKGFASPGAVLTAPETRSSSPVRIVRDDSFMCSILGLLPCGEGAGYAGGITSAAVDGLKAAEKIIGETLNDI